MKTKRSHISKRARFEIFKRDGFMCRYCGRSAPGVVLHVDHVKPLAKGGEDREENMITSCEDCNFGKGAWELACAVPFESRVQRPMTIAEFRSIFKYGGRPGSIKVHRKRLLAIIGQIDSKSFHEAFNAAFRMVKRNRAEGSE